MEKDFNKFEPAVSTAKRGLQFWFHVFKGVTA